MYVCSYLVSTTGRTFRTRDNNIQLRSPSLHATTIFKTNYPILGHSHASYKDTQGTKAMWKTAMLAYKSNEKLAELSNSSVKLGDPHPSVPNTNVSTLSKGHITGNHTRSTNPGYARNVLGGFFTK